MSLLTPWGLLGLLGIGILVLIYLLKPNYQKRIISSTYVWKLSLKYRKKRIPISKLRNILIIICQILIITACTMILTQPNILSEDRSNSSEKIAIIDASAGMLTTYNGETRFERAVTQVKDLAKEVLADEEEGAISVILADEDAKDFVARRFRATSLNEFYALMDDLIVPGQLACSYGDADIDGAMKLAEDILVENPTCEVLFYTATTYIDDGKVTVKNVAQDGEWNAAVLDCKALLEENFYTFEVDVACYGSNTDLMLYCDVYGANITKETFSLSMPVRCEAGKPQTISFNSENSGVFIYSYEYVDVYFLEKDDFSYDNHFYLYGGEKQTIKVEYYSTLPNNYLSGILMGMRDEMSDRWDIKLTEKQIYDVPETEGYDVYIFEHTMPDELPTDGVVILVDMDRSPKGLDVVLNGNVVGDYVLSAGESHPIMNYVNPTTITTTKYNQITLADGFQELMYCESDPVLLVKNEPDSKIAILTLDLNYSNLAVLMDFPVLMYNLFDYFLPSTITDYVYDVGEAVTVNARGETLTVEGNGMKQEVSSFPNTVTPTAPGVYTLTQTLLSGNDLSERIFVKVSSAQSDIVRVEDVLTNPYIEKDTDEGNIDLLIYFASALVALLFIEWFLQGRDLL